MRANGDMLAECWEKRDLRALLAQRFGMFAMEELAEELERKHDDVVRLTLGKSELPVHPAITEAMVDAVRDHKRSSLVYPVGLPALREAVALREPSLTARLRAALSLTGVAAQSSGRSVRCSSAVGLQGARCENGPWPRHEVRKGPEPLGREGDPRAHRRAYPDRAGVARQARRG